MKHRQNQISMLIHIVILVFIGTSCSKLSRQPVLSPKFPTSQEPIKDFQLGPGDYEFSIHQGDISRIYKVHVPPSYQMDETPLVINFHGGGGNPDVAEEGIGGMNAKADQEGFIAVYPQGSRGVDAPEKLNMYYWNAGKGVELDFIDYSVDDIRFISSMLDKLEEDFAVNPNRIYATGISNGAWMSYALACRLSDRIAAVAPVAGGLVTEDCFPTEPVSIIHFHGLQDPGWPYFGGEGCWTDSYRPPIQETIDDWLAHNKCDREGRISFQNEESTCETYSCQAGTEVTFCTIADGGHTFPGGSQSFLLHLVPWDEDCALGEGRGTGKVSQSISSLEMMWDFFQDHPKSTHIE